MNDNKNNKPQDCGRVVVLMGGFSSEREVSLLSGMQVLKGLQNKGVDAFAIDVGQDIVKRLEEEKPDRAFIVLHGTYGEDGVIQGLLDFMHIPYCSSDVAASALTMDKMRCNLFWHAIGLPSINSMQLTKDTSVADVVDGFDFPLCVKPSRSGSSCGVSKVTSIEQLLPAYALAAKFDSEVVVEPWIEGREYTVPILGDMALPVIEIVVNDGFYDYEAKYVKEDTGFICPCDLNEADTQEVQQLALKAFHSTGCSCWGRADFIRDRAGKFWLLEMNTIPGMTPHSLMPRAAAQMGIDFDELVWRILQLGMARE